MIVIPGRIPILIHPLFWLSAFLIGWLSSSTLSAAFIWMVIIFVSVLIHELGHALTAISFKQKTQIQFVALGGLTSYEGPQLRLWQQFVITFNGPLFGFFLFLLASLILKLDVFHSLFILRVTKAFQVANLFWTVVNLVPVLPLDGGQLLRIVLEAVFGVKGFKISLLVSAALSMILALAFLMINQLLAGAIFFLFSFQGFLSWRQSRLMAANDRVEENKQLMTELEKAMAEKRFDQAKLLIEKIRTKTTEGILFLTATQYLAFLLHQEGKKKEAYELLKPIKDDLEDNSRLLLHELAAEQHDFSLVANLSAACYQIAPSQKMALRNARAFAFLNQPEAAGGWLQAASQYGSLDWKKILQEDIFASVRDKPEFKEFL